MACHRSYKAGFEARAEADYFIEDRSVTGHFGERTAVCALKNDRKRQTSSGKIRENQKEARKVAFGTYTFGKLSTKTPDGKAKFASYQAI